MGPCSVLPSLRGGRPCAGRALTLRERLPSPPRPWPSLGSMSQWLEPTGSPLEPLHAGPPLPPPRGWSSPPRLIPALRGLAPAGLELGGASCVAWPPLSASRPLAAQGQPLRAIRRWRAPPSPPWPGSVPKDVAELLAASGPAPGLASPAGSGLLLAPALYAELLKVVALSASATAGTWAYSSVAAAAILPCAARASACPSLCGTTQGGRLPLVARMSFAAASRRLATSWLVSAGLASWQAPPPASPPIPRLSGSKWNLAAAPPGRAASASSRSSSPCG